MAWPGNDLPIFRGNSSSQAKLNDLVKELKGTCSTKYFDEESIRQHIIDSMAERRRAIKKGYDYEKVYLSYIMYVCVHIIVILLA